MKKIPFILAVCLACACAQAQWSKLVSQVTSAAEAITGSDSQKQATASLSEQLKGVYKSLAESYTFNDVSAIVDKVKAVDVSACPASIQEKYKSMADKLDAFRGSLKNYLDTAKISTDKPIKNILTEVLSANSASSQAASGLENAAASGASAAVKAASADVVEKSKSFVESLNDVATTTAAAAALAK